MLLVGEVDWADDFDRQTRWRAISTPRTAPRELLPYDLGAAQPAVPDPLDQFASVEPAPEINTASRSGR
jgi:hypothetical protein